MPATPPKSVEIYDTTLRDGSQLEGISLTVEDKLRIAEQLDLLGVHYIEGGWPGANPKDDEFFERAQRELHLKTSQFVAFGDTVRAGSIVSIQYVGDDEVEKYLLGSIEERVENTEVVSPTSPLGEALIDSKINDVVEYEAPGGVLKVKVIGIE